jgi:hypothetical protein
MISHFNMQEIKFEPTLMCVSIDIMGTFAYNQVCL